MQDVDATPSSQPSLLLFKALSCEASPVGGLFQVALLLIVYAGILYKASEFIAHGSELLLLVPSFRGIVGSIVLPILGAVPDGAIVLFSGLGSNAQEELSVGVGALAGSTCMLLTVPWFLSILGGRVNIRADGVLTYHNHPYKLFPSGNRSLSHTGVQPLEMVKISGRTMGVTALSYLVIQIAALRTGTFFAAQETEEVTRRAAVEEHGPALFCLIVCTAFFLSYLYYQVSSNSKDESSYRNTVVEEVQQKCIRNGEVSITAAFQEIWSVAADAGESTGLIVDENQKERLAALLKTFFHSYDHDNSRSIDRYELQYLLGDLNEHCSSKEIADMYKTMDTNQNGRIELDEFIEYMPSFIVKRAHSRRQTDFTYQRDSAMEMAAANPAYDAEAVDEDEFEEVPHDLRDKDPDVQLRNVMKRAFSMMAFGTTLVLIFSDPIVGVMSDVGERVGIPPFYVSFVLAPLASNASEVLAAYNYALKKTRKTITISFATLLGAAIMNNTFVLSIFMFLIYAKGLAWQFTAETISILVVEIAMIIMSQKKIMTLKDGYIVLALLPMSLFLVAFLENVVGLD